MIKHDTVPISLVIATYNGSKYIAEQLNSILAQTFLPQQIIVVDDCSCDNTVNIVEQILCKDGLNYILVRHTQNQGVNASFEEGIRLASFPYIMICDQDDVWKPTKIETSYRLMQQYPTVALAVCNATTTDKNLRPISQSLFNLIRLPLKFKNDICILSSKESVALLLRRNYITGMCSIFKRQMALDSLPFSSNMIYDSWLGWNAAWKGEILFYRKSLVFYRQHATNVVGTASLWQRILYIFCNRQQKMEKLLKKYQDFCRFAPFAKSKNKNMEQCYYFYLWRSKLHVNSKVFTVYQAVKFFLQNYYKLYTPNAITEFMKDCIDIVIRN